MNALSKPQELQRNLSGRFFRITMSRTKGWFAVCNQAALGDAVANVLRQYLNGRVSLVVTEISAEEFDRAAKDRKFINLSSTL